MAKDTVNSNSARTSSPAAARRQRRFVLGDTAFAYLLNLPSMLIITLLIVYPIGYSLWLSLHQYNAKRPNVFRFVGLGNYFDLFADEDFWNSVRVTLAFSSFSVAMIVVVGILLALVLNESFKGRGLLRGLVLLPWAIPPIVNGVLWQWVYNPYFGALNGFLYSLGIIGEYVTWLLNSQLVIFMVGLAHVWNNLPFAVIVLLAALQAIPPDLYDSAKVDRAGVLARFFHVTLPWLFQPLLIVLIMQTMTAFRVFDIIYVLTGGGPGSATNALAWLTWRTAFDYTDFGHGNAMAYFIAVSVTLLAVVYIKILYARGEIEV